MAILLLALVAGGGCASSRIPDERPQSLREVNRQLDGRWARIQRTDGRSIRHLEDVRVGTDSTTFYHRMLAQQMSMPTSSVRKVQIRNQTGAGRGFLRGAAPGIAAVFLGGAIAATSAGGGQGSAGAAIVGLVALGGGVLVGLVGGASGAVIGDATSDDTWMTIYEGPLANYRS